MSKEQRERILEEYLNMKAIARVNKPLTIIFLERANAELTVSWGQLKSFTAEFTLIDEFWTYVRHGERKLSLAYGIPIFESGDRIPFS
ncbi:hypothetical protein [Sulfurisphaera ohwakuensis]|uniref:hypothetical protein n=1 Tax=Sulfurisphaera ohwakuensis TaxID=69656 RepID=UPI0036F1D0AB